MKIKENSDGSIRVTLRSYYGYWGSYKDASSSNYRLTYTVKKSNKSKYGYVVSKMKIENIAD